jgi:glycosyltransferase involved in cell wall biosynthesis
MVRKRALVLIEDGSFTYDNRVKHETQALLERGWEITVVCPRFRGDPFYQRISSRLRVYFYPKPEANSVLGHVFEHTLTFLLGGLLSGWVFLRHGFDVIHACNPMDVFWLVALPYKWLGRRFIYDQHDLCPELFLSRYGQATARNSSLLKALLALERGAYRTADVVIVTNESYKQIALHRGGLPPDRVFVVRNGPDVERFSEVLGESPALLDGEIVVGYLGNMNQQDGVEYLLEAARAIVHEHRRSDIRFVLIGGGSRQPHLARLAGEMGLQHHVTFTGRVPDDQMLQTLRACNICVQPDPSNALNELSTMNKALEYMAMAKPTVAFDLHETRVSCADAALYARPNSVRDLARKILELADNPELRMRMGRTGQQRILTQLAWPFSIPALLAAYDRVRQEAGKPGPRRAEPGAGHGLKSVRRAERVAAPQQVKVRQSP